VNSLDPGSSPIPSCTRLRVSSVNPCLRLQIGDQQTLRTHFKESRLRICS
jgi:hypothetical protein